MYNGIGLLTPRGSGTSGHVTANSFNIRSLPQQRSEDDTAVKPLTVRKANERMLEHDRKREIELKLLELAEKLEDEGYAQAEIDRQVLDERKKLQAAGNRVSEKEQLKRLSGKEDTHALAKRKAAEMDKLRGALGVRGEDSGEAFDQELQQKRRDESKRARLDAEAAALEAELRAEEEREVAEEKALQEKRAAERRKRKEAAEAARVAERAAKDAEAEHAAEEAARREVRRAQGYYDRDDDFPERFTAHSSDDGEERRQPHRERESVSHSREGRSRPHGSGAAEAGHRDIRHGTAALEELGRGQGGAEQAGRDSYEVRDERMRARPRTGDMRGGRDASGRHLPPTHGDRRGGRDSRERPRSPAVTSTRRRDLRDSATVSRQEPRGGKPDRNGAAARQERKAGARHKEREARGGPARGALSSSSSSLSGDSLSFGSSDSGSDSRSEVSSHSR